MASNYNQWFKIKLINKRPHNENSDDEIPSKSTRTGDASPFSKPWKGSDAVFIVEDKELHVHIQTLSLASPVFEKMFNGNFVEAQTKRVSLEGKSFKIVEAMLKFIYPSNGCNLGNVCNYSIIARATFTCDTCKHHHIPDDKNGQRNMNLDALHQLFDLSNEYMMDRLNQKVIKKIIQESECIKSSRTFMVINLLSIGKKMSLRQIVDNCLAELTRRSPAYTVRQGIILEKRVRICDFFRGRENEGRNLNVKGAFLKKHAAILKKYKPYIRTDDIPEDLKEPFYDDPFDLAIEDLEKIGDDLFSDNNSMNDSTK
ncbi:uncharacterized protein [Clytia hemisphaerica]|uniref:BTB domain-containing protein n=1 Tax=Clytia hemisphaerica TaxID=252671 RepID=A0A7M5VAK3_9CNID